MVRIVENNDWVIFTLLILAVVYLVMFYVLQRGSSLKEFLLQDYQEKQNSFLCWLIISIGVSVSLSVLLSQYIPIVPGFVARQDIEGFTLNKIGVMLLSVLGYYLVKTILTVSLYKAIGQVEKYLVLGFIAQKFYLILSLLLMVLSIIHYYFDVNRKDAYEYYLIGLLLIFIGKNLFYVFHQDRPLPEEWYYKILYICTLQILPLLAIWRFIFL